MQWTAALVDAAMYHPQGELQVWLTVCACVVCEGVRLIVWACTCVCGEKCLCARCTVVSCCALETLQLCARSGVRGA